MHVWSPTHGLAWDCHKQSFVVWIKWGTQRISLGVKRMEEGEGFVWRFSRGTKIDLNSKRLKQTLFLTSVASMYPSCGENASIFFWIALSLSKHALLSTFFASLSILSITVLAFFSYYFLFYICLLSLFLNTPFLILFFLSNFIWLCFRYNLVVFHLGCTLKITWEIFKTPYCSLSLHFAHPHREVRVGFLGIWAQYSFFHCGRKTCNIKFTIFNIFKYISVCSVHSYCCVLDLYFVWTSPVLMSTVSAPVCRWLKILGLILCYLKTVSFLRPHCESLAV